MSSYRELRHKLEPTWTSKCLWRSEGRTKRMSSPRSSARCSALARFPCPAPILWLGFFASIAFNWSKSRIDVTDESARSARDAQHFEKLRQTEPEATNHINLARKYRPAWSPCTHFHATADIRLMIIVQHCSRILRYE
jgi:hypothetical protein